MKIEALHIGMQVKHPRYGVGIVKAISEHTADIRFADLLRTVSPLTSEIEPAEPQAALSGLDLPLAQLLEQTAHAIFAEMGLEKPDTYLSQLANRWLRGKMVLHAADPTLQAKEVPLETFFHKIVMMRNNLRLLEQKIIGHPQLNDAEKIEMQQYLTRCYGSMTTFNILFKNKEDQFNTGAKES